MTQVAQMYVELTADTKKAVSNMNDFSKKLKDTGKQITDIGKNMTMFVTGPILAVTGGMLALATQTGNYADRVLDLTAITGMSAKSIQEWQYVAKIAGVETEAVTGAVEGLVRRLPQLEAEGGRSTEQLAKLGLSFADLNAMQPDQMVDTIIKSLSEMEDPLERNAIGASLFGGAWKDIAPILSLGANGIDNIKNEASELGAVMDDEALESANNFRIEMERLKTEFGALSRELATDLIPILVDNFIPFIKQSVIPAIRDFAKFIGRLIEWFTELSPEMQRTIGIVIGLVAAIGPLLTIIGPLIQLLGVLMSPLGLVYIKFAAIIAIIAGVIAIGVALWQNWDKIKTKANEVWQNVKNAFDKFKSINLFEIGKNIINSLWDGISNVWKSVQDKIADIGNKISGTFKRVMGISSPSKVFMGFGQDIGDGLRIGLDKSMSMIESATNQMSGSVISGTVSVQPQQAISGTLSSESSGQVVNIYLDDILVGNTLINAINRATKNTGNTVLVG